MHCNMECTAILKQHQSLSKLPCGLGWKTVGVAPAIVVNKFGESILSLYLLANLPDIAVQETK